MAYLPIENYSIISDMHSAALVVINGSIDWFCFPRFHSPSVFGAILDDERGTGLTSPLPLKESSPKLRGDECPFNICTFWLVEAMTRAGRSNRAWLGQARLGFEKMHGYANHVGLYAEQTGQSGEMLGNFSQAFTHLSLISAAFNLDRALGASD